ncbi:hypothetical protein HVZ03_02295 [Escherichia fergusonii]|uniref:Uncharacterized protein n=1 Tax=Escherichia fergusonii TaxID=564 RepID=A0A7W3ER15_ESCFE|nr:hypothetical protein [Escherichia fergusonii]EHG5994734.1 hypothetical protein [Escherichia fergusonii]EHG6156672.1 hypothetical protein [Escherichia fergusonii]EHG6165500.1 hypothetical protein [Escherichia fergusonii]EHG6215296.1 hypothetical protein [Escherichia fergusonii]EHG7565723.1 hypothetical protein [Escherichia fergusonii]
MHRSEQIARKKYPDAIAKVLENLGSTTTGKAEAIEAKRIRTLRNQGHELPLNRENRKEYRANSCPKRLKNTL